ncbi:Trk system potassium uptake protein TrkA [compost metagenome]
MGASLAIRLANKGHDVVILDHLRENFHLNLPRDFKGKTIAGMEIDEAILRRAGIERAQAVICVARDENTNMMAADVARLMFNVSNVIVRIDQPHLVEAYRNNGFEVISPISEATNALETSLLKGKEA